MITKDQMVEAIRALPDDATIRDAIELDELRAADAEAHPEWSILHPEVVRRLEADEPLTQDQNFDRERPDWGYRVFYRVNVDEVEILAVQYGARRLSEIPGL